MEKYRIVFTVQDYYDYIGTNPCYSIKERMLQSIPDLFRENGYNIKFKCIRSIKQITHIFNITNINMI